ncbi:MAG TPA: class II glutamine amidotransferase [Coleofasciculaceae cyanobacterium]
MTSKPHIWGDRFIRQCLVDGENSLREQCAPGHRDLDAYPFERITADGQQDDGWGVAFFGEKGPVIRKAPAHAHEDPGYLKAVQETAQQQPCIVLAHLREGLNRRQTNTHPFSFGPWVFMHNGQLPPKTLAAVEKKLSEYHRRYGTPLPQGTTDTERAFYYLLGRLQEKNGTQSLKQLRPSADQVYATFREAVGEMRQASKREVESRNSFFSRLVRWTKGLVGEKEGRFVPPGLNFILSDGDRILASCSGRKLFLGSHSGADGTPEVVLASRPIQPSHESRQPAIEWHQVPDGSVLQLERKPDGIQLRQERL